MLVANAEQKIWDKGEGFATVDVSDVDYVKLMTPNGAPGNNTTTPGNVTVTPAPHVVITIPQGNMSDGTAIYDSQTGTWTFSKPDLYKWLDLGLLLKIVGLA
jgi:hypothetical protein